MEHPLQKKITVRLYADDEKIFGPGVAALLRRVEEKQSLRAAAASMQMAYSKSWTILRNAEHALGFKLLNSTTGGKNGGGASLTAEAQQLLSAYDAYCREIDAYAQTQFEARFSSFLKP